MTAMQSFEIAQSYVFALTGSYETVMDWRCLSDTDRGVPGQVRRGTLADCWPWLCSWNDRKYGVFCTVNEMDGQGRELANVSAIRAHVVDHDGPDATQQSQAAAQSTPAPCFRVFSSPGRYHTYWPVNPYRDNDRYKAVQRKLRLVFNGDPAVIDATRVLRVPGSINWKYEEPFATYCEALPGYLQPTTVETLEAALSHIVVNTIDNERKPLGEGDPAPSMEWLKRALELVDPNDLGREDWLSLSAAWKQSGWTLASDDELFALWNAWCAKYEGNNPAENAKLWRSLDSTTLGWKSIVKRVPGLQVTMSFGDTPTIGPNPTPMGIVPPMPIQEPPPLDCSGEYLTHLEQQHYFKGYTFVISLGKILGPDATFYNQSQFNGALGGKQFIITGDGKKTDEPWKAATRSTLWTIPKVNHTRFVPLQPSGAILTDALGRTGVNMYVKPNIELRDGDVSRFTSHMSRLIPDPSDLDILYKWMAHIIQHPGFKIPWAPVIQSAEGAGKGVIEFIMVHGVGQPYVHCPNAQELADSGGKFNGWMRNKIFILADEIKVDEKRHMIEVLKPIISREIIEVQSKGVDQEMLDNPACWGFFTNYKDAIPVSINGRRYSIFFSPIQSKADLIALGMDDGYFKSLYNWIRFEGGKQCVVKWLIDTYPVECGDIPMRAPITTSWNEAVSAGRSPIERVIAEAVEDGLPGFRGGWVSSIAAMRSVRESGAVRGNVAPQTIETVLQAMGYVTAGRADRPWFQEDKDQRATLYWRGAGVPVVGMYGVVQGYV